MHRVRVFERVRTTRVSVLLAALGSGGSSVACSSGAACTPCESVARGPAPRAPAARHPRPTDAAVSRQGLQAGCGCSKCGCHVGEGALLVAGSTRTDAASKAAQARTSELIARAHFQQMELFGAGWQMYVARDEFAAVKALLLADEVCREFVYDD